jgi:hypothetical protein
VADHVLKFPDHIVKASEEFKSKDSFIAMAKAVGNFSMGATGPVIVLPGTKFTGVKQTAVEEKPSENLPSYL